jgi:hypothetical protein
MGRLLSKRLICSAQSLIYSCIRISFWLYSIVATVKCSGSIRNNKKLKAFGFIKQALRLPLQNTKSSGLMEIRIRNMKLVSFLYALTNTKDVILLVTKMASLNCGRKQSGYWQNSAFLNTRHPQSSKMTV